MFPPLTPPPLLFRTYHNAPEIYDTSANCHDPHVASLSSILGHNKSRQRKKNENGSHLPNVLQEMMEISLSLYPAVSKL